MCGVTGCVKGCERGLVLTGRLMHASHKGVVELTLTWGRSHSRGARWRAGGERAGGVIPRCCRYCWADTMGFVSSVRGKSRGWSSCWTGGCNVERVKYRSVQRGVRGSAEAVVDLRRLLEGP